MKILALLLGCILLFASSTSNATSQTKDQLDRMKAINARMPNPIELDFPRIKSQGIIRDQSQHLTLFTDIRDRTDVREFGKVFDHAVAQWCAYFDVSENKSEAWHMRAMLVADRQRFQKAGLFPSDLPNFLAGFQRGHEMWVYLQPGRYYTRHLLLHEGTHAFMQWYLDGTGAPWYSEGMAELLSVHSWNNNQLQLNFQLSDRSQAEYWGRVKLIREDCSEGKAMSLDEVFAIPGNAFREVRYYAWSWAACQFLSKHPETKMIFRKLQQLASESPAKFNATLRSWIAELRPKLDRDWNLFVHEIDFGYDVGAGCIQTAECENSRILIDSRSSWQLTNIRVESGDQFAFKADGRFTIARENDVAWPCEAGGITIDYYAGNPLGRLMIAVLSDNPNSPAIFSQQQSLGKRRDLTFEHSGVLAFRINESPAKLADNSGKLTVRYKKLN